MLLVDLPPGTGDVQMTMMQKHKPAGAVIVSTPQDLALIDATRAIELFAKAHVPIIGLVENMAGYVCPHCGESQRSVRRGGVEARGARPRACRSSAASRWPGGPPGERCRHAAGRGRRSRRARRSSPSPRSRRMARQDAPAEQADDAVTRRGLLAGAAAGGGLLVAWALRPRKYGVPLTPGARRRRRSAPGSRSGATGW